MYLGRCTDGWSRAGLEGPYSLPGTLLDPPGTRPGPPRDLQGLPTGPRPRDLAGSGQIDGFGRSRVIEGGCTPVLGPFLQFVLKVAAESVGFNNLVKRGSNRQGNSQFSQK